MCNISNGDFSLTTTMDLDEVKDAVRRWRHDFNRLTFERQRHHEELERLRLHEKLFEDNEKLLRQENAALKSQLSNHCLVLDRLKKLRVQYDALKEDLDDARATMCANVLECDEKMDEKQREWERLVRANAEELSACEAAANQKLESERRAHEERMDEVLKELEAQRAKMKAMEQQHRCELIALQLERDEQLMQMEGKLRKLQSSGHDVCRQKYAALHRELTDLKARMTSNDDDIVGSSPDERGVANGNSTPVVGFQPSSTKQRNDVHRGAANDNHEVHEISEDEGEAEAILPTFEAPSGVGDNAEGVIGSPGGQSRSAQPAGAGKDAAKPRASHEALITASPVPDARINQASRDVRLQAATPRGFVCPRKPPGSPAHVLPKERPKRRKLLLEVEDVLFVDAE
ncbi:putative uncharacterized protein MYH16 [Ixodes scapularis]|uniref:putative uncharacterized protein MYH16 n=1 Tax=Ixodes scapularis TaxID=6945 RepID=UPI001C3940E1|nr:putative uncharacterized protein MYH16 [Ixodes scapularis]